MTEVEELYELVGVEPRCNIYPTFYDCAKHPHEKCEDCVEWEYPPFTAEKQIELIKLLQRKNVYKFSFSSTNDNSEYLFFAHKDNTPVQELIVAGDKCYEEALASFINTLWQDLTEAEQNEIKNILKG